MKLTYFHLTLLLVFLSTVDYRFFGNQPGIISFTSTELFCYLFLLLAVGTGFLRKKISAVYRLNKPMFWYVGWALLSALINGLMFANYNSMQSLKDLIPAFVLFVFLVTTVTTEERLKKLLLVYFLGIAVNAVVGFFQLLYNQPRLGQISRAVAYKIDFSGQVVSNFTSGFFSHPNAYAMFLLPAVLLTITVFKIAPQRLLAKFLLVLLLFSLTINYWYTQAKISLFFAVIGSFLILFPFFKLSWRWLIIFLLLSLMGSLIFYGGLWLANEQNYVSARTLLTRLNLWQTAFYLFFHYPLVLIIGGGSSTMIKLTANFWPYPTSHNFFLDQIIFYGFPALLFFSLAVIFTVRQVNKKSAKFTSQFLRNFALFLIVSLLALLANWFFEPASQFVSLNSTLFLLFGLASSLFSTSFKERRLIGD